MGVNRNGPAEWRLPGPGPQRQRLENTVDEIRIPVSGDPFYAAAQHDQERPHACVDGVVYIGHMVEGEDGEEVEVIEAVPCRRCAGDEPR